METRVAKILVFLIGPSIIASCHRLETSMSLLPNSSNIQLSQKKSESSSPERNLGWEENNQLEQLVLTNEEIPKIKQDMLYADAREILVAQGWKPEHFNPKLNEIPYDGSKEWALHQRFPEVVFCSDTGWEICHFELVNSAKTASLLIQTSGSSIHVVDRWKIYQREEKEDLFQIVPHSYVGKSIPYISIPDIQKEMLVTEVHEELSNAGWYGITTPLEEQASVSNDPLYQYVLEERRYRFLLSCDSMETKTCQIGYGNAVGQILVLTLSDVEEGQSPIISKWGISYVN